MKAAYNQNNLEFDPLSETYEDPCDNCIFIRPEEYTCILANFGEELWDELPICCNGIFTAKPLSNIFKL